jgi:hypothetical protein
MYQDWYIKREIQGKQEKWNPLAMGYMREAATDKEKHSYQERKTKMQSKIDKHIMAPIYAVGSIFIDWEEWMTEVFRHSQETIRTISEEKVPRIVNQCCYARFPEIPPGDESFHLLHLENITPILLPENNPPNKCSNHQRNPEDITVFFLGNNMGQQYDENIPHKNNPREITPRPIDDDTSYDPENDIPESLMCSFVDEYCLVKKWEHDEDKSCEIIGITQTPESPIHIESCLIKWRERIETYLLKYCINENSEKANKAGIQELSALFWRNWFEEEKERKKSHIKKPSMSLFRITRGEINIPTIVQPEWNNCPQEKNSQRNHKTSREENWFFWKKNMYQVSYECSESTEEEKSHFHWFKSWPW